MNYPGASKRHCGQYIDHFNEQVSSCLARECAELLRTRGAVSNSSPGLKTLQDWAEGGQLTDDRLQAICASLEGKYSEFHDSNVFASEPGKWHCVLDLSAWPANLALEEEESVVLVKHVLAFLLQLAPEVFPMHLSVICAQKKFGQGLQKALGNLVSVSIFSEVESRKQNALYNADMAFSFGSDEVYLFRGLRSLLTQCQNDKIKSEESLVLKFDKNSLELSRLEETELQKLNEFLVETKLRPYRRTRKFLKFETKPESVEKTRFSRIIIIPYRDRREHLEAFLAHMRGWNIPLMVIEQGNERGFNRGALLNIGATLARPDHDYFIFHDVDSLPDVSLKPFYLNDDSEILQLANPAFYKKYAYANYLGGVTGVSFLQFSKANGFPNNFFGWGAEDNAFYNRLARNNEVAFMPESGAYHVLDHKEAGPGTWNPRRKELLLRDLTDWEDSGLNNMKFEILKDDSSSGYRHLIVDF